MQNYVSLSTTKAKYIIVEVSCAQMWWMKYTLQEYDVIRDVMILYFDNMSAINISKKHVLYTRTKHIDIHHHFIRELVEDRNITL